MALALLASCAEEPVAPATLGTSASADALAADASLDGSAASDATSGDTATTDATVGDGTTADGTTTDGTASDATAADSSPSDIAALDGNAADAAPAKYPLCSQLLTCVGVACSSASTIDCAQPCLSGASAISGAAIQPFLKCTDQYCAKGLCAGVSDPKCLMNCSWQKCLGAAMACGGDGKTGTATCASAFGCMEGCKDKGGTCIFDCYAALSGAAQAQFDALGACSAAAGGKDPFEVCPNQALTCIADGKTGTDDCWKLASCTNSCEKLGEGAKAICIGECWAKASKVAQAQWIAIIQCGEQSSAACSAPLVTCIAPSGTKTCLDTLGCWETCNKASSGDMCGMQCLHDASPTEGKKVVELMQCMAAKCGSCKGAKDCEDKCLQEQCKAALNGCLAP